MGKFWERDPNESPVVFRDLRGLNGPPKEDPAAEAATDDLLSHRTQRFQGWGRIQLEAPPPKKPGRLERALEWLAFKLFWW